MGMIIKIALGILLAMSIMFIGKLVFTSFALKRLNLAIIEENKKLNEAHIKKVQLKKAEKKKKREQARKKEIQNRIAREKMRLKEQAWSKWYKEPKGCDSWTSDAHMVECTNHRMKSKQEFNVLWNNGSISNSR